MEEQKKLVEQALDKIQQTEFKNNILTEALEKLRTVGDLI